MAEKKLQAAIDVIVRATVSLAAYNEADDLNPHDFVHNEDYDLVVKAIREAAAAMDPGTEAYEAAVEYLASKDAAPEPFKVPVCSLCRRERTLADAYDYNPIQAVTGQPLGWYSGDDGEMCPECMTKTLRGKW